jgi:hypothetical protein
LAFLASAGQDREIVGLDEGLFQAFPFRIPAHHFKRALVNDSAAAGADV